MSGLKDNALGTKRYFEGKGLQIYQVDAFTNEAFKGNPAGVCLMDEMADERLLQSISSEMNLSETAFVATISEKSFKEADSFLLRWFTPLMEVPLCGHATLAACKVLFDIVNLPLEVIRFITASGQLTGRKEGNAFILDFPIDKYNYQTAPTELLESMGVKGLINTVCGRNSKKLILHIESEEELSQLKPDFEKMKSLAFDNSICGVAVTTKGKEGLDFVSRYFNPWAGVNEDPVTGSVHTVLASYWGDLLNKKEMLAYQKSQRGGKLHLRIKDNDRVEFAGEAVVVMRGELLL